jgi:hypothetical protein
MDDKKMEQQCKYLRIIERTRLLCNTTEELENMVGFSLSSGNGLSRMGGKSVFLKDAIFRELAHQVEEDYGLDLQQVLESYIEADQIFDKYKTRLNPNTVPQSLIRYFYGDREPSDDIAFLVDKIEYRHVTILVLMLSGALPRISSKGGDVKNIEKAYQKMSNMLRETVCANIPLKKLPALIQMEDTLRQGSDEMNRMHLIYITDFVLDDYGKRSTQQRITQTGKAAIDTYVFPDIEGVWTEDQASTVFWVFKEIANGYTLFRYLLNEEKKELRYTKYFVKFYSSDGYRYADVLHPKVIDYLLKGEQLPNQYIAYYEYDLTDGKLSFDPIIDEGKWFGARNLTRSGIADRFDERLADYKYTKVNEFEEYEYDFNILLAAITRDYIYVKAQSDGFYKIPKTLNECLTDVTFKDEIGIITYGGNTYLAFDTYNLFYDISTPERLAEIGVTLVDSIKEP